jgi:hypothetical protein
MIDVGTVVRVTQQGAAQDDWPEGFGEEGVVVGIDEVSYYVLGYTVELFCDPGRLVTYFDGDIEEV